MRKAAATVLAFAIASLLTAPALWARNLSLEGRVFDADSGRGVAAVTITLRAPKSEGGKETVTSTNDDGKFALRTPRGLYLLSASRGSVVLYRKVIEVGADLRVEIPLQRRSG